MDLNIVEKNAVKIAELVSNKIEIINVRDSLDLMGNADYLGARSAIIYEKNITPEFFDLKTKIAGNILQKYTNYNFKLAIIGNFQKYESKALNAFVTECNRGNCIFFVKDKDSALNKIAKNSHGMSS